MKVFECCKTRLITQTITVDFLLFFKIFYKTSSVKYLCICLIFLKRSGRGEGFTIFYKKPKPLLITLHLNHDLRRDRHCFIAPPPPLPLWLVLLKLRAVNSPTMTPTTNLPPVSMCSRLNQTCCPYRWPIDLKFAHSNQAVWV